MTEGEGGREGEERRREKGQGRYLMPLVLGGRVEVGFKSLYSR
jgi:hypothetical protein